MTRPAPWEPTRPRLDEQSASELIAAACPDLAPVHATKYGEGFDFEIFGVGALAFRFPKREAHADRLRREASLLARIGEATTTPIPQVVRGPFAVGDFPWQFAAMQWLPGTLMMDCDPSQFDVARLGADLGRFIDDVSRIPLDEIRHLCPEIPTWLPELEEWQREQCEKLELLTPYDEGRGIPERLRAHAREAPTPTLPPEDAAVFVHADLHGENIVLDPAAGTVAGVIDFGDIAIGDIAFDLAGLASWGGEAMLDAALTTCGPRDDELRPRALWLAIWLSVFGAVSYTRQPEKHRFVPGILNTLDALLPR